MDVADAVNIMTYASKNRDGTEGHAVWHIYRRQDLASLRGFLSDKFRKSIDFEDPIHAQVFYLDETLRRELRITTGVVAHEIHQYPVSVYSIPMTRHPRHLFLILFMNLGAGRDGAGTLCASSMQCK